MKIRTVFLAILFVGLTTGVMADEHLDMAIQNLESEIKTQEAKLEALKASHAELKNLAGKTSGSSKNSVTSSNTSSVAVEKKPKSNWRDRLPEETGY